jgi:sugar O-acyltransferase (sialic acid O-acetyltransferase NeuD family)
VDIAPVALSFDGMHLVGAGCVSSSGVISLAWLQYRFAVFIASYLDGWLRGQDLVSPGMGRNTFICLQFWKGSRGKARDRLKLRERAYMTSKQPYIILGFGGNCLDVLEILQLQDIPCLGFLDDAYVGEIFSGASVLGSLESARDYPDARFVNCIGSTATYRRRPEILARTGLTLDRFGTVIHPTASVSASAEIGPGTVLFQHVTLAAKCRLGAHVTVLPQSVVSHDCVVEDYSILAGGVILSGAVHVERCCYLGANSAVRSRLRVGEGSLVGMGSNVVRDVPSGQIVVGNPARILRPAP